MSIFSVGLEKAKELIKDAEINIQGVKMGASRKEWVLDQIMKFANVSWLNDSIERQVWSFTIDLLCKKLGISKV